MKFGEPFIIEGYMNSWPCFSKNDSNNRNWGNINYLKQIAGHRTVNIEIGKNYLDNNLSQKLITFNEFIEQFIENNNETIGYLAQTKLLDQIPELKKDIKIPEYCSEQPIVNAWFGPKNTITPLHFDPKNNFLCQVVGYKYIKLYHSKYSNYLYPNSSSKLYFNTSMVDIENPNYEKYQKFKEIEPNFLECVLRPGDILFIPKLYYHFVKSLSISFSLSFWWG
ncbi:hypothetical protein DICPUDRAFT_91588 [Dictyostelium purpureum]|uniref:JmjC domain-containing protein n=1 Tax=Dictyostelium purpureum TaxID=5786 RepID=F0ZEK3_DICPU|nr:uncharacterized protein DICPUDRAFT_91588 [Dictyostelium purpureum]EGC37660.1 hypothetical protein DICPUDRAFT_91588 [Dictyostelium purpureum]|eukprot:XP_003285848.1 hypothetical protein DICPUDRAFT_91588 [Dictyostelium purpureum]